MTANRNLIIASIITSELVAKGVEYAIIAAGSRSTPLTIAFTQHPSITAISQIDERSAGFLALGIAQYTRNPVVIISTSGTATANFYPAVIEAEKSKIPLLVLTADRPPYLRNSGANQTINQVNLYGGYVRAFTDLVPPNGLSQADSYIRREMLRHYQAAANPWKPGPTHINIPFDKPLVPPKTGKDTIKPLGILSSLNLVDHNIHFVGPDIAIAETGVHRLSDLISGSTKILIIAGPKVDQEIDRDLLFEFSSTLNIPIFADGVSGLRIDHSTASLVVSGYESFLRIEEIVHELTPDLIIQVGQLPVSKSLLDAMATWNDTTKVIITQYDNIDTSHYLYHQVIQGHVGELVTRVMKKSSTFSIDQSWLERISAIENVTWDVIDRELEDHPTFEGTLVRWFVSQLLTQSTLFISSSLAIRHVDQFVRYFEPSIQLFANRGASGIDGTLSSALGVALAHPGPSYLLSGDLSFLHDVNGLYTKQRYQIKIVICILNNGGGAIFDRLPISNYDPPFTEYFFTPQHISFEHLAKAFGCEYQTGKIMVELLEDGVIEFKTKVEENNPVIAELIQQLRSRLLSHDQQG